MKLIHACWGIEGQLYIWGETPLLNGSNSVPETTHHQFAMSPSDLRHVAEAVGVEEFVETELTLDLPSRDGQPLPSHLYSRSQPPEENAGDEEVFTHAPFRIPALSLTSYDALSFLSFDPMTFPEDCRLGSSAVFWTQATRFLLELLARGRYLPLLEREGDSMAAKWRPVVQETADVSRLESLVSGMPPACSVTPDIEGPIVVHSFLRSGCDALVKGFLRRHPLAPEDAAAGRSLPRVQVALSWLRALTSEDSKVPAFGPGSGELSRVETARLEEALRAWSPGALTSAERIPLRIAFRLTPPPARPESLDQDWSLEFFFVSALDSTHLLPARDFWAGDRGFLTHTPYTREELELLLLEAVGRAARRSSAVRNALRNEVPHAVNLSLEDAYRLLKEDAPALEDAGIELILPAWWRERRPKFGLQLELRDSPSPRRPSSLGLGLLFDFSWQISLGETNLSADEFSRLVDLQAPLVPVGDTWVELPRERLNATLKFLEREKERSQISFSDALRLRLGLQSGSDMLPVTGLRPTGWLKRFLDGEPIAPAPLEQPPSFQGTLRHYQLEGMTWLDFLASLNVGGCLADDMGLGKTIQFLALLLRERELRSTELPSTGLGGTAGTRTEPGRCPTLLIVPMSILGNWERECRKFAPSLRVYLHHGTNRLAGEAFRRACTEADLVVTTYALAHRDEEELRSVIWERIALDEAQNIKNFETKQSKAIRRLVLNQIGKPEFPLQRVALTGTPLENHLDELWSILDFLNPGLLGTMHEFRTHFATPVERFRDQEALKRLAEVVRPFILRRMKSDPRVISDLPEKMEIDEYLSLTPEQAAVYQRVLDEMLPQVQTQQGMHRKGTILAAITRLKQVCDHPSLVIPDMPFRPATSGKLLRLAEILETIIEEGDRALVFTQYARMGELLQRFLQERFHTDVPFLHGALTRQARDQLVQRFQSPDGPPFFVLSLKAGGFGLNLTAANQVIHFDQWWNPAVESQATDRVYRIGQTKNVQVRRFICRGTLEEKIAVLLQEKRQLAADVLPSAGAAVTELSFEELRRVLSLSPDVFVEESDE